MPTFLDQTNDLLLTVGELPVSDFDGYVARKAVLAFQQALRFVSTLYRWPHLRSEVVPTSWVGDTVANLPEFQSVIAVFLQDSPKIKLPEVTYQKLQEGILDVADTPTMWAHRDQRSLQFRPVDATNKAKLRFYLLLAPTVPVNVSDNITLDAQFLQCVTLYAESILHRTHTTDLASANASSRQFEVELQTLRTRRESDTPTTWRY
jgi:hypothetical protein